MLLTTCSTISSPI